ncbi:DUF2802 domain-containing protein [Uliginosibacterium sp. H3]|uniref:DUF2802 domain-containing protein n=1 Tax=Uliginosibacterium silvisoli TaxID=3114758 RepID=A0ABU6K6Z0_9RHOO|nr:DUF2802 domain-containing protein [Uliginosibacterium sp. H3]
MELRTVLIVLLVVLCIYMAWLAIRWRRAEHRARSAGVRDDRHAHVFRDIDRFGAIPVGQSAAEVHAYHADDGPSGQTVDTDEDDSVVSLSTQAAEHRPEPAVAEPARTPRPAEPDASGFGFDALLEVRQMRHLVDETRAQNARLSDDVARLREELAALRAASRVAPAYAEAVSMVQRGLDAQAIAERCGISVAEAELVRALSDQHGAPADGADAEAEADENFEDEDQDLNHNHGRRHD